jgi:hypothetical protein
MDITRGFKWPDITLELNSGDLGGLVFNGILNGLPSFSRLAEWESLFLG